MIATFYFSELCDQLNNIVNENIADENTEPKKKGNGKLFFQNFGRFGLKYANIMEGRIILDKH